MFVYMNERKKSKERMGYSNLQTLTDKLLYFSILFPILYCPLYNKYYVMLCLYQGSINFTCNNVIPRGMQTPKVNFCDEK